MKLDHMQKKQFTQAIKPKKKIGHSGGLSNRGSNYTINTSRLIKSMKFGGKKNKDKGGVYMNDEDYQNYC